MPGLRLKNMLSITKILMDLIVKRRFLIGWIYGGYSVIRIARKSLFIFITVSFVVFATNIMLLLHISWGHNSKEPLHSSQDSSNCPVCQKLLTSLTSFNIEPQIIFVDRPAEQHTVPFRQNINLSRFHPEAISPRGPPAYS